MLFVLRDYYDGNNYIIACVIYMLVMIVSFSLHEFAHAFTAYKCGDNTPKIHGRVTINPLAHIDPVGFIFAALFFVGWAKPVQVNPLNFKHYRKDMAKVSVAGVITNFILAFICYGVYAALISFGLYRYEFVRYLVMFFSLMYSLNCMLAVFNFLPFYPLDGFNFLDAITSKDNGFVNFLRKYGTWILLAILIIFSDFLSLLVGWVSFPIALFWGLIF